MITKLRIAILALLTLVLPVGGVTMTLNPQLMVVGSTTEIPVTMLEMRCSSDGTLDIQYLVNIRILRRKFTEPSFTGIALWKFRPGSLNGDTQLESNLPQDILSRTPNVSASIDPSQKSGLLVVTMNGQGLTCSNQAEFNCSLSYMDLTLNVRGNSEIKNFTVTATPNDVLMDSAEYYDNNGNTLQLTNNMQLSVGTRIKYKCTANIGSLATGEIIWDRSPELQGSNTPFIPYTPTVTTDIIQEDPQLQPDGCSYKRISTMHYNLTSNDNDGITFRCRARSYLGSQWYEAVSNEQFRTVAVLSSETTKPTLQPVGGASITIIPLSVVVGSSSANPVTRLEVQCNSGQVSSIEVVYRLEISRRRFGDQSFVSIAAVDAYKITKSFPADMKSPNATGSLVSVATGEPPTSGTLVVTMDGGGLTCSDQAEFKCTMSYQMIGGEATLASSDSNNFTVITAPNDVRIIDALYEENGVQLQLANDSKLNVGTRIKYRCTANIGSDSTVVISWERSPVTGTSTDLVPYIPDDSADIVQDQVVSTSCSNTRTSSMYYNMTNSDDDGVTFRCKVRSYLVGNWYESISIQRRTFSVLSSGTTKPTLQTGSSGSSSTVLAAVLGVVVGVLVILLVILSLFLHRSRRLTTELQSKLQSRSHTYDGLIGTVAKSEPYAILNVEPTENDLQRDYVNPYDQINRTVGSSEQYDMLESLHSDANVHQEKPNNCDEVGL